jgi:sugar O-acyltransferase (sialic acid O-acetyltransferase NeuD family)
VTRIAIIGAGDLGEQLAHQVRAHDGLVVAGFFDDQRAAGTRVADAPVLGGTGAIEAGFAAGAFDQLLIAVGYKHMRFREAMYEAHRERIPFATLVHPRAWVDPTSVVGPGAVLYPGCVVDMNSSIGANALLNVGCVIAHHSKVGAGCFLSPGVQVAGFVDIAPGTTLGIGTVVIDNITIPRGVRTGAGAVVIRNPDQPGLYVGVPARLKKPEDIA